MRLLSNRRRRAVAVTPRLLVSSLVTLFIVGGCESPPAAADLREIEDVLAGVTVQGERYPAFLQAMVDR